MNDAMLDAPPERVPWYKVRVSPARQAMGVVALLLAIGFFAWMFAAGMRFFAVESMSMEPTLLASDRIVAFRAEEYRRGDIVVLRDPTRSHGYLVKRLMGLPGDTVEVFGGAVRINGVYASEPYRPEPIDYLMPPFVVPEDGVFVLGDNANWSVDSHNWNAMYQDDSEVVPGAVPEDSIVGRVRFVYLPLGRSGRVSGYPLDTLMAAR